MSSSATESYITWADEVFNPWLSATRAIASSQGEWTSQQSALSVGDPREAIEWNRLSGVFLRENGRRRRVFAGPWCRVFADGVAASERDAFWRLVSKTPAIDWLVLLEPNVDPLLSLPSEWGGGFDNVWIGIKVAGGGASKAIAALRRVAARLRFLVMAPILGDVGDLQLEGVGWVILSTPPANAEEFDAVASVRLQCAAYGVPCWFECTDRNGAVFEADAWRQEPKMLQR
jgi:protein gp37